MNQIPRSPSDMAAVVRRSNLYVFVQSAFAITCPGKTLVLSDYLEALCFQLQEVAEGRNTRLIVTMPPRYLKSIVASVILPAWILGRDPGTQIIVASYGDTLAREHSGTFRRLVASDFYKATFPGAGFRKGTDRMHEYKTAKGGGRRSVTPGGAVTGLGADVIIVDDLMKAADAISEARRAEARTFYDETLHSRLNDKTTGTVVTIQQRLHQDDLVAHMSEKGNFRHLNLPAIAEQETQLQLYYGLQWTYPAGAALCPEREDLSTLEAIRAEIGHAAFQTQYQQDPASAGSCMLDATRLTLIAGKPQDCQFLKTVQTWDTAVKTNDDCDYSVCATFGWNGELWVLADIVRERLDFGNLKARALQLRHRWNPEVVCVEDAASGPMLVQELRQNGFFEFTTLSVNDPKVVRFAPAAEWLQDGRIGILHQCHWYPDLRRELLAFPGGRHDDQVDAISLFVQKMRGRRRVDPNVDRRRSFRSTDQNKRDRYELKYGIS